MDLESYPAPENFQSPPVSNNRNKIVYVVVAVVVFGVLALVAPFFWHFFEGKKAVNAYSFQNARIAEVNKDNFVVKGIVWSGDNTQKKNVTLTMRPTRDTVIRSFVINVDPEILDSKLGGDKLSTTPKIAVASLSDLKIGVQVAMIRTTGDVFKESKVDVTEIDYLKYVQVGAKPTPSALPK